MIVKFDRNNLILVGENGEDELVLNLWSEKIQKTGGGLAIKYKESDGYINLLNVYGSDELTKKE